MCIVQAKAYERPLQPLFHKATSSSAILLSSVTCFENLTEASCTRPAFAAGATTGVGTGGGAGREGLVDQAGNVLLGDREKEQGSGTGSGGRFWVYFHDQHSWSIGGNLIWSRSGSRATMAS